MIWGGWSHSHFAAPSIYPKFIMLVCIFPCLPKPIQATQSHQGLVESCWQFLWWHHRQTLLACPKAQSPFPELELLKTRVKGSFPWLSGPRMQWVVMQWVSFVLCLSQSFLLAISSPIYFRGCDARYQIYVISPRSSHTSCDITEACVLRCMCWAFPHPCRHTLQHSISESQSGRSDCWPFHRAWWYRPCTFERSI